MNPPLQRSEDILSRNIENFVNICENASDFARHRDRLNVILNDLNSIELQHVQTRETVEVSFLKHLLCIWFDF